MQRWCGNGTGIFPVLAIQDAGKLNNETMGGIAAVSDDLRSLIWQGYGTSSEGEREGNLM